ncbi:type IV pilus assembly protein PilF [Methylococcus capsulatus]|uniref:Type IV pilus assembly protein PilF n=1 Tax=Methylococcus capsulatus TaxID=414 RepID=A0AA35UDN9_METCP|nr:type IV pilus assembly protein PilF [Methylococcus capsulatus]
MRGWLALTALLGAIAACATPEQRPYATNDPYGELSTADVYVQKGVRYMAQGALEVALEDLKHAVELDPANSDAHDALAILYEKLGRTGEADLHFREALTLNPENYSAYNNYGRFLCHTGHTEDALARFEVAYSTPLYPQPWIPLSNAGTCLRRAGRTAEAEPYLRRALEKNPGYPPALLEMAHVSLETRQYLSTRAFLQRYQAVAGDTPETLWLGVQTELALGDAAEARRLADRIGLDFPDSGEAVQARRLFAQP